MDIRCPICSTVLLDVPSDYEHRPFCSARCKRIDLGNWLGEKYRISRPVQPDDLDLDSLDLDNKRPLN